MRVLVTGAGGYIGRGLVRRLAAMPGLTGGQPITAIVALDLSHPERVDDPRVRQLTGSVADAAALAAATAAPPDLVFHLAAIPSGLAETDYERGLAVNLRATLALLDILRTQGRQPGLVFTSSIAVFGAPLPERVDDDTPPRPALSYGAHKQAAEILIDDATRRGWVRGRSVRLPGIVMRPPAPNGALSIFSSDLIRALAAGARYTCPVSPVATLWLMSRARAVDNLLHAAGLDAAGAAGRTAWTLPALRVSVAELLDAGRTAFGAGAADGIGFAPQPELEAQFGRLPPLATPAALAAGFQHDGDLPALLRRAVEDGAAVGI